MKVMFGRMGPSGFGAASWSLPTMDVRVEVRDSSYIQGGRMACRRRDDAVGCLVRSRMFWLLVWIIFRLSITIMDIRHRNAYQK